MRISAFWLIVLLWAIPYQAHAYIDPGTGSALIQGLIAGLAALGVTLKLYWHRFVLLFNRDRGDSDTEANTGTSTPKDGS